MPGVRLWFSDSGGNGEPIVLGGGFVALDYAAAHIS
jgi:hypothetical protein